MIVRYADDCNIYVKTERAGERVLESVKHAAQRQSGKEAMHWACRSVEIEGEPEEEQGRTSDTGEVSWVQFLEEQGRSVYPIGAAHEGTLCGKDTPSNKANTLK